MDWKCGSSSRVPALQEENPEFKPWPHQKQTNKQTKPYIEILSPKVIVLRDEALGR
jgi:hypothetical protein